MDSSIRFLIYSAAFAILLGVFAFAFLVFPIPQIQLANKENQIKMELIRTAELQRERIRRNGEIKQRYLNRVRDMITGNGAVIMNNFTKTSSFEGRIINESDCFIKELRIDIHGKIKGKKVSTGQNVRLYVSAKSIDEISFEVLPKYANLDDYSWSLTLIDYQDSQSSDTYFCGAPLSERASLKSSVENMR